MTLQLINLNSSLNDDNNNDINVNNERKNIKIKVIV